MVFGSFWTGIQPIELDPKTELRHPKHPQIRQVAWNDTIEPLISLINGLDRRARAPPHPLQSVPSEKSVVFFSSAIQIPLG
jgi:hypothetical protein